MSGTSMNDIKARMKSVESTGQITKAMELVATSKLRRAKEKVERTRPFHQILGEGIRDILSSKEVENTPFTELREVKNTLFVVVAGDRGLAGGYNANIFRLSQTLADDSSFHSVWLPIGKKACEYYAHRKKDVSPLKINTVGDVSVGSAMELGRKITDGYLAGDFDRVVIIYTKFKSMLSQIPTVCQLLPLETEEKDSSVNCEIEVGVEPIELLMKIVPEYLGGVIYSCLCESSASESASRRTAMNSANKNASEMIDDLMLRFNRARQSAITQEITEIVSGAEAL